MVFLNSFSCCNHIDIELESVFSGYFFEELTKTRTESKPALYKASLKSEFSLKTTFAPACLFHGRNINTFEIRFDHFIKFDLTAITFKPVFLADAYKLIPVPIVLDELIVCFYAVKIRSLHIEYSSLKSFRLNAFHQLTLLLLQSFVLLNHPM